MRKSEIIHFVRDETCPRCQFPETLTVCKQTSTDIVPLSVNCRKCDYTRKIPKQLTKSEI